MKPQEEDLSSFYTLARILEHLRGPEGCPWDREQTHHSLKGALLEECYEAMEAIEKEDMDALAEELGDILVHVVFHSQMAKEAGRFALEDVVRKASEKLVRRHPHVFGDATVADAREVEANWEAIKAKEREGQETSMLDGAPRTMPALAYSQAIQGRASRNGFDWDNADGVMAKVMEELGELRDAPSAEEREKELGDVFFALVNLGRWLRVDAEGALRRSNESFYQRYSYMERVCRERGLSFQKLPMVEKEALWEEAKAREREGS